VQPLIALLLIVLVGLGSYSAGYRRGASERSINITDPKDILNGDFSVFWSAVDLLKQNYVNIKDVSDSKILYGAIAGAVAAAGDPYTTFFEPSDATKFEQDVQGSFGGIGAEIGEKDGQVVVVAPLKGSPAEKAGLRAEDQILEINGTSTEGMAVEESIKLIRGEVGVTVTLLIMRKGWDDAKEFPITREVIQVPTLDWGMKDGGVAYFKLHNFNANAATLFFQAAIQSTMEGMRGIVFDLRDNPGGYLEVSENIAGWFVDRGSIVVRERFQSGKEELSRSTGNAAFAEVPVVVLVNGGSASASEILAGALRDNRGAKLIGEKTFGKGSVQEIENLKDGSSLKISIAEWLTPNGTKINGIGLSPDIEVKLTDGDIENKKDPQLDKALEVIRQEIAARN